MEHRVTVRLENAGQKKIAVIRDLRQAYGFDLRTAKNWADKAPVNLPPCGPGVAGELIRNLRDSGATVSTIDPTILDTMVAAGYVQDAANALSDGDLVEARAALRAALACVGDV